MCCTDIRWQIRQTTTFDYNMSIEILVIVVLGRMGSIGGSIITTVILTVLPEAMREFSDYRMLAYSVALILIMVLGENPDKASVCLWQKEWEKLATMSKTKSYPLESIVPERDANSNPILECAHLGIDFGGLTAVDDFSIAMGRTEISGLIGPNGAGKTTIFNLLTNVYKPPAAQ